MKDLLTKRGQIEHRLKQLIDTAEVENRDLNAEENTEYDRLISQDNELRSRIERQQKLGEIRSDLDQVQTDGDDRPASRVGELRDGGEITDEVRSLAFQAWHLHESRMKLSARHVEACRKVGFDFDVKEPEFQLAGNREVRSLQDAYRTAHPSLVTRSLNVTNDSDIVPQGFVSAFEQKLMAVGGMLQAIRIHRSETGNPITWPTLDDTGNEGEILAEEGNYGASVDPATGSVVFNAYRFSSKPVLVSRDLIEDSAVGLAELLGDILGERIGKHLNRKLTTGTGTNEPNGLVTAATVGETAVATNAITSDELIDLIHSVDPSYRGNAAFMLHDSIVAYIRKLKDSEGNYLWQPGLVAGVPDRLLGHRVVLNQAMASSLAASAKPVAYGDFNRYVARIVRGLRLRHLTELYAATDQEAFVGFLRADGDILNASAIKVLQMAAV